MSVPAPCLGGLVWLLALAPPPPPPSPSPAHGSSPAPAPGPPPPPAAADVEPDRPPRAPGCRWTSTNLPLRHQGPGLAALHAAALAHSPVDARALRGWQRRARASAALPSVSVGWDHRRDHGYDLDQMAGTADDFSSDGLAANTFRVRVDWSLDRLVFNPDELRAARAALDWLDWRERLLDRVTALHAEYWALVDDYRSLRSTQGCSAGAVAVERRLDEVAGHLLAITGRHPAG